MKTLLAWLAMAGASLAAQGDIYTFMERSDGTLQPVKINGGVTGLVPLVPVPMTSMETAAKNALASIIATPPITANQTITISGDASGSGATAITLTLPTVATAGTYSGVTVNAKGLVTAGTNASMNNAPARSLVTTAAAANGTQISSTRDSQVSYSIGTSTTATIGGASSAVIVLEICSTNSATAANWITIAQTSNGQTITLAVALQSVQTATGVLAGRVPAGYYSRIRQTITGTASASFVCGQEVLY